MVVLLAGCDSIFGSAPAPPPAPVVEPSQAPPQVPAAQWQVLEGAGYVLEALQAWERRTQDQTDGLPVVLAGERHESGMRVNLQVSYADQPGRSDLWQEIVAAHSRDAQEGGGLVCSHEVMVDDRAYLEIERVIRPSEEAPVEYHYLGRMALAGQRLWRVECGAPTGLWEAARSSCAHVTQTFRSRDAVSP